MAHRVANFFADHHRPNPARARSSDFVVRARIPSCHGPQPYRGLAGETSYPALCRCAPGHGRADRGHHNHHSLCNSTIKQANTGTGEERSERVAGHSCPHRIPHTKLSRSSRGIASHRRDRRQSGRGSWDTREFFAAIDHRLGRRRGQLCVRYFIARFCVDQSASARGRVPGTRAAALSRAGAPHARAADATNDRLGARRRHQWHHHGFIDRRVALANWRATRADLRRVRVSRRVFANCRRVSRFHSHTARRAEHGRDKVLAGAGRDCGGVSG